MPTIEIRTIDEFRSLVARHRAEIEAGIYGVAPAAEVIAALDTAEMAFLVRHCPAAHMLLAKAPCLAEPALEALARSDSVDVRRRLAQNQTLPAHLQDHLARDRDPAVRAAIARSTDLAPGLAPVLARDGASAVRAALAACLSGADEDVFELLVRDASPDVRAGAATNPRLPERLLIDLADDPACCAALISNPNLPDEAVRRIAASERSGLTYELANRREEAIRRLMLHPRASADIAALLIRHHRAHLIAQRSDWPAILQPLAEWPDPEVRRFVASYRHANVLEVFRMPEAIADRLLADPDPSVRIALLRLGAQREEAVLAQRIDERILRALAADADPDVRIAVTRERDVPLPILKRLLHDRDRGVREHAARHPNAALARRSRSWPPVVRDLRGALRGLGRRLSGRS